MPIQVAWDNDEQTVIRYDFQGSWSWSDYSQAVEEADRMMLSVDHTVDAIANLQHSRGLPTGAIHHVRRTITKAPPQLGVIVIAHPSLFVQAMTTAFNRVYPHLGERILLADTLDEARALIARRRRKNRQQK